MVASIPPRFLVSLPCIPLVALGAIHVHCVIKYAVDLPIEDDWIFFTDGFRPTLDVAWLFRQHNEHRMVPTRVIIWLLYWFDGWNLRVNHMINAGIYALLVLSWLLLLNRSLRRDSWKLSPLMACFLLQGAIATNILWGIQSSIHLCLLFIISAILLLFTDQPGRTRLLAGSGLSVAAAYSFATGALASVVIGAVFVFVQFLRYRMGEDADRRAVVMRSATVGVVHVLGLAALLALYTGGGPPKVWPHESRFWAYYIQLLSLGFGSEKVEWIWGRAIAVFAALPVMLRLWQSRLRLPPAEWALVSAWCAFAAVIGSVTFGRAGFGSFEQAKSERYTELAAMMVPASLALWQLTMRRFSAKTQIVFWASTLTLLLAISHRAWDVQSHYVRIHQRLVAGEACVRRYLANPAADSSCPEVYPWSPLAGHLALARELGLSFTRH
jgi:hypothetical protein